MPNILRRAAVAASAAAALTVAASVTAAASVSTANPASPLAAGYSNNWAGYTANYKTPLLGVQAEFTVPRGINCANSLGSKGPYYGALWTGIGGFDGVVHNYWLEQDGVTAICANKKATTKPSFFAWWTYINPNPTERYPNPGGAPLAFTSDGKPVDTTVHAGDKIFAQVDTPRGSEEAGKWDFYVYDETTDQSWTEYLSLPASAVTNTGDTAEVVTEDPVQDNGTVEAPFVDLGPVTFNSAEYFTGTSLDGSYQVYPVTQHRIDMYRDHLVSLLHLMVYPTQPVNDGYSFSTKYTSYWKSPLG